MDKIVRKGIDTKIENLLDCRKIDFLSDIKEPFPVVRKLDGKVVQLPNSPLLRKKDIQKIGHCIIMACNVLFNNREI